ncbi:MAG: prepilin-type N-terminal cleavage/methylation domain-containing protein [Candidatus Spechtbacterales bacterium]|nr:prepilin-type N-terminal cleavage/methylation domain-containing protein [Candidatus Spechtbacterales bacterium]
MRKEKGFTLLEVLISIFVLTVGVGSMLVLISDSLQTISATRNSVVAANLAQEGIEVVRGIRDSNWIDGNAYDTGITDGSYCVNFDSISLINCAPDFDMYWNDGTSRYSHVSTSALTTPFEREIIIQTGQIDSDGNSFIRVESIVRWDARDIVAETHLYDWH